MTLRHFDPLNSKKILFNILTTESGTLTILVNTSFDGHQHLITASSTPASKAIKKNLSLTARYQ